MCIRDRLNIRLKEAESRYIIERNHNDNYNMTIQQNQRTIAEHLQTINRITNEKDDYKKRYNKLKDEFENKVGTYENKIHTLNNVNIKYNEILSILDINSASDYVKLLQQMKEDRYINIPNLTERVKQQETELIKIRWKLPRNEEELQEHDTQLQLSLIHIS